VSELSERLTKITKEDLLFFALSRDKTQFKDFSKLCNNGPQSTGGSRLSRETMNKYIDQLLAEGSLERELATGDKYPHYYVPKNKRHEVQAMKDNHQADLDFERLPEEEKAKIKNISIHEKENNQITLALAVNGWLTLQEIAAKTGIDEKRTILAIWGKVDEAGFPIDPEDLSSMISRRLIAVDKEYNWPRWMRSYGLSFAGVYWALKKFPESFGIIIEKWSETHPFIFQRYDLFRKHGLEGALREFILKLDPINFWLDQAGQVKDIEDDWLTFVPREKGGLISNWFDLLQEDSQFRERAKTHYRDGIVYLKQRITSYEIALKAIDNLCSKKPDRVQIQRDMGFFVAML